MVSVTDGSVDDHGGAEIIADISAPTVWAHSFHKGTVCLFYFPWRLKVMKKKIGIIMGSDSDLPTMRKAADTLASFGVPFEVHIMSAHRTPNEAAEFAKNARANGFAAIIAAAGMAAHLGGVMAAYTTLPVVGVPCKSTNLDGLDALLATVQMPTGIPVATVAIDGAANAALLAAQILALSDPELDAKLVSKREKDAAAVLEKDAEIAAQFNK